MRFAELLGLTWENVDLEKGTIKVKRAWDYLDTNNFCPTKNEQSVRNVPIDKQTCLLMKWFKKQQTKLFKKLDIKPEHDFVFYNAKSGLVSNNAVNKKLKEFFATIKYRHAANNTWFKTYTRFSFNI